MVDSRSGVKCLVGGRLDGRPGAECLVASRVDGQQEAKDLADDWELCQERGDRNQSQPSLRRRRPGIRPRLQHL